MAEIVVMGAEQLRLLVRQEVRTELARAKGGELVAAAGSGLSARTFRRLVKEGKLDGRKVGRAYLVRRESLEAYLAERNAPQVASQPPVESGAEDVDRALRDVLDAGRLRVVGT